MNFILIGELLLVLILTFLLTWLFAKLKIFDFIGKLGCGGFVLFRLLEVAIIFVINFFIVIYVIGEYLPY